MIDPRNMGTLTGRLVADPEIMKGKVVRFSMAADYAGVNSADKEDRTGFFDCVYFLRDDNPNSTFVKGQIDAGNLKKGSSIQVAYALVHQRWEQDGNRRSKIELKVESIAYSGSKPAEGSSSSGDGERAKSASSSHSSSSAPSEF